ncbi:trichohyalin-like [Stylophora pistillata]|nr:trichohyalin-like [Stylophora pistillata]XP_022799375.1 trichohyalin-like [Stylophora pistillata]
MGLISDAYQAIRSLRKYEQHPSGTLEEIETFVCNASYASGRDQSNPKRPDRQKEKEKQQQKSADDPHDLHTSRKRALAGPLEGDSKWLELTLSLDGATGGGDAAATTIKKEEELRNEVKWEQEQGDKKQEQEQKAEREKVGKGIEGPNVPVLCNCHEGLEAFVQQQNEESNQKSLRNEIRIRGELNRAIQSLRRDIQDEPEIKLTLRNALDEQRDSNLFLAQLDRPNSKRPDLQKEREKERQKLADNPLSLPANRGKTPAGHSEEVSVWSESIASSDEATGGGDTAEIAVKKEEEIRSEVKRKQEQGDKKQEQEQKAEREEVGKGIEGPNLPGLCNGCKRLEALVQQQNEESNRKNLRNLMSLRYEVYVALQSLNRDIQHLAEISLDLKKEREKEQQEQVDDTLAVQTPSDRPVKIAGDGGAGRGGEACGRKAGGKKNKKKKNSQHK